MVAADRGNDEIVELLLNMTNIDVNAKDDMNRSALWIAVDGLKRGVWYSSDSSFYRSPVLHGYVSSSLAFQHKQDCKALQSIDGSSF